MNPGKGASSIDSRPNRFMVRLPLRLVLTLSFVFIVLVTVGVTNYLAFKNEQEEVNDLVTRLFSEINARVDQHLDNYLDTPFTINQINLNAMRQGQLNISDTEQAAQYFWQQGQLFRGFGSMGYANDTGELAAANEPENYVIITSPSPTGITLRRYAVGDDGRPTENILREVQNFDVHARGWYQTAEKTRKPVWTDISPALTGRRLDVTAVTPYYNGEGRLQGVFYIDVSLAQINRFLSDINISRSGQIFIMEPNGYIVASSTTEQPYLMKGNEIGRLNASASSEPLIYSAARHIEGQFADLSNISGPSQSTFDIEGERHFVYLAPYRDSRGLDWIVGMVVPESDFMAHAAANFRNTILLIALSLFMSTVVAILVARRVTQPLSRLSKSAKALAQGDWEQKLEMKRGDEVGELADAFNTMAARLKENLTSLRESEERFRTLVEQAPEAILVRDVDTGLFVDANRNAEQLFGCSREDILKSGPQRFYPQSQPDNLPVAQSMQEYTGRALAGETVTFERTVRNAAGKDILCQVWLVRLPSSDRRLIRGSYIDITERKRMEEALKNSEEHFRSLYEQAPLAYQSLDHEGHFITVNQTWLKTLGYGKDDIIGRWFGDFVAKESLENFMQNFPRFKNAGKVSDVEFEMVRKDGSHILVSFNGRISYDEQGHFKQTHCIFTDITKQKRAEERLTKLNNCMLGFVPNPVENINRLTALCGELMGAACALYNRLDQGMLCSWGQWNTPPGYNPVDEPEGHICYDTINRSSDEILVVRNLPETVYARTDPNVIAYNLKTYVGRAVRFGEDYVGSLCVVYQKDFVPDEDDKRLMGVIASAIAVEERRRQSEKSFKESELRFRSIVESANDAIIVADSNRRLILWNKCAQAIFGYTEEEMKGKPAGFMIPERYRKKVELIMSTGKSDFFGKTIESTGYRKDGIEFPLEISFATWNIEKEAYYSVIIRDITERKRAEKKLRDASLYTRSLIEVNLDPLVTINLEGKITDVNRAAELVTGLPREKLIGSDYSDYVTEPEKAIDGFHRVLSQGFVRGYPLTIRHTSGKVTEVLFNASVYKNEAGEVQGVFAAARDITEQKRAQEQIELLKHSVDVHYDGAYWMDTDNRFVYVNDAGCRALGYGHEELIGMSVDNINPKATPQRMKSVWEKLRKDGFFSAESLHRRKDGSEFPVEIMSTYVQFGGKEYNCGFAHDITERKRAEEALRESETRYRTLFERAGDYVIVLEMGQDNMLVIEDMNEAALQAHGYSREEILGRPLSIIDPDSSPEKNKERGSRTGQEGSLLLNVRHMRKDGTMFDIEANTQMVQIGGRRLIISVERDITERKRAEEKIMASLKEKEVLLREIHHRVKNNMQIISSLLRLQSENIKDEEYLEVFKDSYNRIKTMSLVHEKLYQSGDFTNINFKDYIHDLVGSIYQSHFIDKEIVSLNMDIEDVSLGIDTAIPCGLIINELVTNSLKYAFPDGRYGEIGIILNRIGENRFELVVSDNGVSIPQDLDFRKTETLGLRLVSMLVEDQLLGEISLDRSKGTEFKIRFRS